MLFRNNRFISLLSALPFSLVFSFYVQAETLLKPYFGLQVNHIFIDASQRNQGGVSDFSLSQQTNFGLIAGVEAPLNVHWSVSGELLWQPNGHAYTINAPAFVPPLGIVNTQTQGELSGTKAISINLAYQLNSTDKLTAKVMRGSYDWKLNTRLAQAPLPSTQLLSNQGSDFFTAVGLGYQKSLTENIWLRPEAIFFVETEADKNLYFKFTTYELALSLGYSF